jgi:type III pantothenate kinase
MNASELPPRPRTGRGICSGDTVLLADVGNSRIKLGRLDEWQEGAAADGVDLPSITHRHDLDGRKFHPDTLERWLQGAAPGPAVILIASVSEAVATRLEAAIAELSATRHRPLRQRRVCHADLPLVVSLPSPERVGIDRLAAAAAATFAKPSGKPAVVVDCGTAATVDLVAADGTFLGGAILPGPELMARALASGTSQLPVVESMAWEAPPLMPGRSTEEAIAAGVGFGFRGAVARVVAEASRSLGTESVTILAGGWRSVVRDALPGAIEIPDIVLCGVAMAAARACAR